jgi:FKBP-type peptidyl-prolyl cis-trans isomerase 2
MLTLGAHPYITHRFINLEKLILSMKITQFIDTTPKKLLWMAGIMLVAAALILAQEPTVGPGDTVVLEYTISINGVIADTSEEEVAQKANIFNKDRVYEPLVIIIGGKPGEQAVAPPAVEKELLGMKVGEEKVIRLYPLDAYGYWNEENVIKTNKQEFIENSGIEPVLGQTYQWGNRRFQIYQITDEFVYLDFNHRFAANPNIEIVSREEFEQNAEARVGNIIIYQDQYAVVIEVTEDEVILDVNPTVYEFKIEIIQIKKT